MKTFLIIAISILMAELLSAQQMNLSQVTTHLTDQPLTFTKNMGQWPDSILFRANGNGAVMWFTKDGVYQQFFKRISKQDSSLTLVPHPTGGFPDKFSYARDSIETTMIKTTFVASNVDVAIETGEMLEYKCNYFLGNDSSKWATDVPNYTNITYKNIYSGIDLRYYGNGKQMEYDFVVSPGADPSVVKMRYDGAASVAYADNGDLVVKTKWGEVIEQKPVVYSEVNNKAVPVRACFNSTSENSFNFAVNDYDKTQTLIIDPVLVYSTYLGGNETDGGLKIEVGVNGNVSIVGSTESSNFPVLNQYQNYQTSTDLFVTKLSGINNSLIFSTFIGGHDYDFPFGIAVDTNGNTFMTGETYSSDFPTVHPYQLDQPASDVLVAKLSTTGNVLLYSTYLGGSDYETGYEIAVDDIGDASVTGHTYSSNFPTQNPFQTDQPDDDVFVTKLSSTGDSLLYSTYLGGDGWDEAEAITVADSGYTVIVGSTSSTNFPTINAYQNDQPSVDIFITKITPLGDDLIFSTYLGGDSVDNGWGCALDASGNVYITGVTKSSDFPTINAYQSDRSSSDAFVTKLSFTGDSLIYSTYLGGDGNDGSFGVEVNSQGNAFVTGYTQSSDFPLLNPYQADQPLGDAFVTELTPNGDAIAYSTYLGGNDGETAYSIALNKESNVYITGVTTSTDFPTVNPYQMDPNDSTHDAFIARFSGFCCIGMRGDVNNSNSINVLDLNYLVSYFFSGGPAPVCSDEANINGLGGLNVLDLNYLVAYFFSGGPPPVACP